MSGPEEPQFVGLLSTRAQPDITSGPEVRIQSGPAGPVRQIWVSGPVRSGNSYAQSGQALVASPIYLCQYQFNLSLTKGTMPLKTTVIGAWPKPEYLKLGDWFQSGQSK